jgi:hypothetical protein
LRVLWRIPLLWNVAARGALQASAVVGRTRVLSLRN